MAQNDAVKFVFIPVGEPIPEQKEEGTIYFCAEGQKLYVGDNLIANADGGGGDIDIEINGEGDYIASAGFSNNVLTLTKSSLYDTVDNAGFASEGYVNDAIASATADLLSHGDLSGYASEGYVDDAISPYLSATADSEGSAASRYLIGINKSSAVDGQLDAYYRCFGSIASDDVDLVTGGVVYSAMQSIVSSVNDAISSMRDDMSDLLSTLDIHTPTASYDYICAIDHDSNTKVYDFLGASFGSITSTSSAPVTGSAVYSAISGLASKSYVDTAISSATSGLLSKTHVTMNSEGADYSNKFLYYADGGSTDTVVNLYYAEFGSVSDSNPYPVTGGAVYGYVNQLIDGLGISGDLTPAEGQYLYAVAGESGGLELTGSFKSFGSVVYGDNNLVTGGIVHDAIINMTNGPDFVTTSVVSTWGDLDGKFLIGIDLPSNAGFDPYILEYASIGQVTSTEQFFVPGSAIYSAIAAIPTIPSYSATDEGKVLKIVNGEPAWVSI